MSDDAEHAPKPKVRMALRPKEDRAGKPEPNPTHPPGDASADGQADRRLLLRQPLGKAGSQNQGDHGPALTVSGILDKANRPHLRLERRARWRARIMGTLVFIVLCSVFAGASYYYAHTYRDWPTLEGSALYVPFLVCVLAAALLFVSGFTAIKEYRRYYLGIFNMALALALLVFNLRVLEITSQHRQWSPWLENTTTGVMLSHELLVDLRAGYPPDFNTWYRPDGMQADLANLPKPLWRPFYHRYLTANELAEVNYLNVDDFLPLVAQRAHADTDTPWNEAAVAYQKNTPLAYLMRLAASPYSLSFRWLR